ncbi:MAG: hypothetical protein ACXVW6_02470, partial [Nocardioidaceae bacterium]
MVTGFSLKVLRFGVPLVPLGFLVYGIVYTVLRARAHDTHHTHVGWAVVFASALVWVAFVLLGLAARPRAGQGRAGRLGWVSVLLGADGRLSTSKSAIWLWTAGVAYALLFVTGIAVFVDTSATLASSAWEEYLLLLGGPFGAGVLAKYAVVTKLNNGTIGKTLIPGAAQPTAAGHAAIGRSPQVSDVVSNDNGSLDVVDAQYFVFNLVAFAYAAGTFLTNNFNHLVVDGKYALPSIPSPLLALSGAAAATYVANKAIQKDSPAIDSVVPSEEVRPGDSVLVRGVNLVTGDLGATVAAAQTRVWLTPGTTEAAAGTPVTVAPIAATPTSV